jgi:hypothetical protein
VSCATPQRDISRELIIAYYEMQEGHERGNEALLRAGIRRQAEAMAALVRLVQLQIESNDPAVIAETRRQMIGVRIAIGAMKADADGVNLDPDGDADELLETVLTLAAEAEATDGDDDPVWSEFQDDVRQLVVDDVAAAADADPISAVAQLGPWLPAGIITALRGEQRARSAAAQRPRVVMRAARQRHRHAPRNRSSRRCGRRGPPARTRDDDPDPPAAGEAPS